MTAPDAKEKRPLSDLARETRRQNAIRLNQKRRQAKASAPPVKPAEEGADDPVVELIRRIVDERLEERLSESRSGSTLPALALLGVQMLANSSIVPALVSRLAKKPTETAPSEQPSTGLAQWLDGA